MQSASGLLSRIPLVDLTSYPPHFSSITSGVIPEGRETNVHVYELARSQVPQENNTNSSNDDRNFVDDVRNVKRLADTGAGKRYPAVEHNRRGYDRRFWRIAG